MGIMDSVKDKMKDKFESGSQSAGAMEAVSQLMDQSGGVQGLIQNFQQQGLGNVIQSWIGKGPNLPIQPNQLRSVVGEDRVEQISQKTGRKPDDLLQQLSRYLPDVVDKLTPDGQVDANKFSGSNLVSMGKNLFH